MANNTIIILQQLSVQEGEDLWLNYYVFQYGGETYECTVSLQGKSIVPCSHGSEYLTVEFSWALLILIPKLFHLTLTSING
jgi:hypothetical protein